MQDILDNLKRPRMIAPLRCGCEGCDNRPEEYFAATGYRRGFIWHFDAGERDKLEAEYAKHAGHAGRWALMVQ